MKGKHVMSSNFDDQDWMKSLQSIKAVDKIESDLERLRRTAYQYQDLIDKANSYQSIANSQNKSTATGQLYDTIKKVGLYDESFQSSQDRIIKLLERSHNPQDIQSLLDKNFYSVSQYIDTYNKLSNYTATPFENSRRAIDQLSNPIYETIRLTDGQTATVQEAIERMTTGAFIEESAIDKLNNYETEYYKLSEITRNISELAIQNDYNHHHSIIDRLKELSDVIPRDLYGVWPNSRISIQVLVDEGWFPDFSVPIEIVFDQIHSYYTQHEEQGKADANMLMVEHFEEIMENIDEYIPEDFPEKRILIIKEAIQAHMNGMYKVSTPIFLIQADGYAHQKHEKPIWGLPRGEDGLFAHARKQQIEDEDLALIVEPLISKNLYLAASQHARSTMTEPDHGLNRNTLLHGINTDYGSRENSARCFSFFWYTVFFMETFFTSEAA